MAGTARVGAVWLALALSSGSVCAQVSVPGPVIASPNDIDLGPDEELVVREYIIRRGSARMEVESPIIRPGSIIPEYVELEAFEDAPVPALRRYAYFVSPNNKVVVVEPASRAVVSILDR